jgi:flagellin
MSVINTNVKSLAAQNALTFNNRAMSTTMEQLSTGKRINSAKDDAAGLAISEKMTSQVRGLNQAIRNANDGISLLQTAEGAMVEITNMMQRMRELAVQSANDTNAQDDRNYLDLEFQQLKAEINRVTQNTQWNGMNILDQTEPASGAREGTFTFQVGANTGDSHKITHKLDKLAFGDLKTSSIINNTDVSGPWPEQQSLKFAGTVTADGDFVVDGIDVEVLEGDTAEEVAAKVVTALSGDPAYADRTVALDPTDSTKVLVTFKVSEGEQVPLVAPTALGISATIAEERKYEATEVSRSTVTFGSGYEEGNVITLTVNNKQLQYTVTAEDIAKTQAPGTPPTIDQVVAEGIFKQLGGTVSPNVNGEFAGLSVRYTASDNQLVFQGSVDQTFESFTKVTDGKLATVDALKITSQSFSDTAIAGLDTALTKVNEARAEIGAVINRLNYAVDNMTNVSMNTSESRSRILDTDYAKASAELARTQIISQAATAMLAQANQQPQSVLQLLQG